MGENAEVEFEPTAPLFVEPFAKCAALGRFAVMDSNRLKMLGKVSDVTHVMNSYSCTFWHVERDEVWMDPTHLWTHNTELQHVSKLITGTSKRVFKFSL